jgi:8-oxo-dGTP diphosphatase
MQNRISSGCIVLEPQNRVAMVRHCKAGAYNFWVAPGGGVKHGEDVRDAARREAFEEASIRIGDVRLIAIEQLVGAKSGTFMVKHWFFARLDETPTLRIDQASSEREFIAEVQWLSRANMIGKTVFPSFLLDRFWNELAGGFGAVMIERPYTMKFE